MCKRDPVFYIDTFVWTFNPKDEGTHTIVPFITWPIQELAVAKIMDALGKHDLLIEKSRDMGVSWLILLCFLHQWQFMDMQSFLLGSRKEELVDKIGDPRCLFWKMDFAIRRMPSWLVPPLQRKKLSLINLANGSTIDGESTNSDFARGDRRRAIMLDEFAAVDEGEEILSSSGDATNCRIFNSTPKGTGNSFYTQHVMMPKDQIINMHWSTHPSKAADSYRDRKTGKIRSPWYDAQCKRRSPQQVAQELDIDFMGSDYQFFDQSILDRHDRKYCRTPFRVGDIDYDPMSTQPHGFSERDTGPFALWIPSPQAGDEYVVGVDVATGTLASESVISVASRVRNEKVAEYITRSRQPYELAAIAVAICRWFKHAFMVWEANGPGREFGLSVIESGFRNIYYKKHELKLAPLPTDIPGWHSTKDNKNLLLGEYRQALAGDMFINRSHEAIRQCSEYIFMENQSVAHARSEARGNPTLSRENHGDRVIADALVWRALKTRKVEPLAEKLTPKNSFAARRDVYIKSVATQGDWW